MSNRLNNLAAIAGIVALIIAIMALLRDVFDYRVIWEPPQAGLSQGQPPRAEPSASKPSLPTSTPESDQSMAKSPAPATSPSINSFAEDTLSVAAPFRKLESLLAKGQWKAADQETNEIIVQRAISRGAEGRQNRIIPEDVEKGTMSCDDIRTIDQLWTKYSNGHFGFTAQKRIWEYQSSLQQESEGLRFGTLVGWRPRNGSWLAYDQLTFDLSAPEGHLPSLWFIYERGWAPAVPYYWSYPRPAGCAI